MNFRTNGQPLQFRAVRVIAVACAILCPTMFAPTARAADRMTESLAPADAADDPAYRKAVKEGLAEYAALHFEEARSLFRRAHRISPNARTFRGIGMTSFELRDYVAAVRNLSAALKDNRKPLSPEQRKHAQDLLDRSRMLVDAYSLTVSPRDARVLIDGRAPEIDADGMLLLSVGLHNLEVSAPGMTLRSLPINARGGERKELSVTLEPAFSGEARTAATATPKAPATRPAASNRAATAWLLVGGGAALLAVGSGIYWAMQNSQLNSCRHPANPHDSCDTESLLKLQRNVGIGATAVTGAAAVTMALIGILSWHSASPDAKKHSALDCSVGPFGLACGGRF